VGEKGAAEKEAEKKSRALNFIVLNVSMGNLSGRN
jgi:hypothetical protein